MPTTSPWTSRCDGGEDSAVRADDEPRAGRMLYAPGGRWRRHAKDTKDVLLVCLTAQPRE